MQRLKNFAIPLVMLGLVALPSITSSHRQENSPDFSPQTSSRPDASQRSRRPHNKFVKAQNAIPNRYIVLLNDDVVSDDNPREVRLERVREIANRHALAHAGRVDYVYETALKGYAIELPNEAAARAISNRPEVQWVEEDDRLELAQAPTSPQSNPPWGLDGIDGTYPTAVPNSTTGRTTGTYQFNGNGAGVNVYVLDTGINTAHVDFQNGASSRAIQAGDCIRNNDCKNGPPSGFVDGVCVPAPNTINNDCHGHGTHVAATIGGNTYGVAKGVSILSVKVCVAPSGGCPASAAIAGINFLTNDHVINNAPPAVANISLSGVTSAAPNDRMMIDNAVNNSINSGVTFVVAAGNQNHDARDNYPADVAAALTVGAVDWARNRWINSSSQGSNWGPAIDLFAPGVFVLSAQVNVQLGGDCSIWNGTNTTECHATGTSQAAAHVSGAVAMYLQNRTGLGACNFPIEGPAPPSPANLSTCPDRVTRYIKANANLEQLTPSSINGTNGTVVVESPNRFLWNISVPTLPNPLENHRFFIWTQYADLLNRDPDNGGMQFYVDLINNCAPSDTECLKVYRGLTSANFLRSPEFGGRGGYVANLFNIVFGQRPKTVAELSDPTKVERPHYTEFVTDLQSLSAPTDAEVDVKKSQLASNWMLRAEVLAILPDSLNNTQFVQKLENTAGVPPLPNEAALIASLDNHTQTRAQVLRTIAESPEITNKFTLQNFVTMQYIGHLRREPENCHGSPDPANCGYIFHYNRFGTGGDPHEIENLITRGFIESPEYRRRFGPV